MGAAEGAGGGGGVVRVVLEGVGFVEVREGVFVFGGEAGYARSGVEVFWEFFEFFVVGAYGFVGYIGVAHAGGLGEDGYRYFAGDAVGGGVVTGGVAVGGEDGDAVGG